ncbi:hypothetical protein YC2023_100958 [Brassica napus]
MSYMQNRPWFQMFRGELHRGIIIRGAVHQYRICCRYLIIISARRTLSQTEDVLVTDSLVTCAHSGSIVDIQHTQGHVYSYMNIPLDWQDAPLAFVEFDLERKLVQGFQECDVTPTWTHVLVISNPQFSWIQ